MSLYINRTGQPGKEAVPVTRAFRLTTAGAGHFREEDESQKKRKGDLTECGQSYKKEKEFHRETEWDFCEATWY